MAVIAIMAAAAAATGEATVPSEQALAETVRRQSALIATLEARVEALEARLAAGEPAKPPAILLAAPGPVVTGPPTTARTTSAVAGVKLRGRLQADAWTTPSGDGGGAEVRRARLGVEGRVDPRLSYLVEIDVAGGTAALQDARMDYAFGGGLAVRAGYHKIPFSLTDAISSNYELFLEPPVGIKPFIPGRGAGLSVLGHGRRWFVQAGAFGQREHDGPYASVKDSATSAIRLVWAPVNEPDSVLHLGASAYETHLTDHPDLRIRSRPERDMGPYLLDTGPLDLTRRTVEGLEFAATHGPVGARAEGAAAQLDQRSGGTLRFGGYAASAWWTLTGEPRPYRIDAGTFDRQIPFHPLAEGGLGAIQFAVRYSHLDLADPRLNPGSLSVATLGLNWYLTAHARMMLDVNTFRAKLAGAKRSGDGLGGRVQLDW